MESIRIHDKNYDIVLYLDSNKFFGYKFNKDNTVEKINKNVFKYFDFFTCSNNFKILSSVDGNKVVLDNDTSMKHFFKGGSEDYEMFFKYNGEELISYQQNGHIRDFTKKVAVFFVVGTATVCLSLEAFELAQLHINNVARSANSEVISEQLKEDSETLEDAIVAKVINNDIKYEDIKSLIYSSNGLSKEEKEFLDNEDLINDVLLTVNEMNVTKYDLLSSFKDLSIKPYSEEMKGVNGYYKPVYPNTIFVKNYEGLNTDSKETIAHEYIHLLQYHYCDYGLLKETTAEIISDEYFDDAIINAYHSQITATKKLMEIIGPDAIWQYVFTDDFSLIEKEVRPYLSDDQYLMFLDCLKYDYYNSNENVTKINKLNSLLEILYKNKYNNDMEDDIIISALENPEYRLKRYYFNKRYINKENSYYEDKDNITSISMTMNEAVLKGYLIVEEEQKEYVEPDKVYDFLKTHENKGLKRHCSYVKDFKETSAAYSNGGVKISGYLNNTFLNNVSEEELIEMGIIISCKYFYIKDKKKLTPEEFFEGNYDQTNRLNYILNSDKCYNVTFNSDGDMDVYFSTKVSLPTIEERNIKDKVR